ncbi:MAG: hypothetical protein OM95_08920 [Bdellovibrio sp. ArHS]|uniref:hypothetical protein n=1 Tax=Bdellovibrio sp. ArHS TaxID=1569284 RepID=UPI000583397F|nr:hypothetical protein [Bdellovibrio sp. ArHS]KHD88269.1 MAG: hypothetical protein OM95_08920 [Bdellovibrio sp. ArHS]
MKAFFLMTILFTTFNTFAATLEFTDLSLSQGFEFNESGRENFGHLTSLQVDSITFPADLTGVNPLSKKRSSIVGAISSYSWTTGLKAPMNLSFNLSAANVSLLRSTLKRGSVHPKVVLNFQIYAYNETTKSYYMKFKTFTFTQGGILNKIGKDMPSMKAVSLPIEGSLKKLDGNSPLKIADNPSSAVTRFKNYTVQIELSPIGTEEQNLILAENPDINKKLSWGVREN